MMGKPKDSGADNLDEKDNRESAEVYERRKLAELLLRQKIGEMIMTASLEVDGFLAEVDSESNHIRALKDTLTNDQTKALSKSSFGSNFGTAGGAVGSALGLAAKTATAGGWVGALAGGFGAIFGFVNWHQTSASPAACFPTENPKEKGICRAFEEKDCPEHGPANLACSPSMLYHLLPPHVLSPPEKAGEVDVDRQATEKKELFHSWYDPVIRRFVEERKDQLDWIPNSKDKWEKFPEDKREKLTSYAASRKTLSTDELGERQTKLADLRALVARINRDLSRLSHDVSCYDVDTASTVCPNEDEDEDEDDGN